MTIQDVCVLLGAELICGDHSARLEPAKAYASDMMSDVLARVSDHTILLTGLVNEQVVRTAAMLELGCVIIVRGKTPSVDMIKMAEQNGLAMISTRHSLFDACGILFKSGVEGDV